MKIAGDAFIGSVAPSICTRARVPMPAAQTTTSASIQPAVVSTPVVLLPVVENPTTLVPVSTFAP
ncbi:hypothetical protein D3C75_1190940 [compost metagenome]